MLKNLCQKMFGRSLWVYHANSGGCNGCDIEVLNVLTPYYDVERFGIKLVGSPRHADVLLDQPGHVGDQGLGHEIRLVDQVQQRGAAGRPTAAGEDVLVPIERHVQEPLEGLFHPRQMRRQRFVPLLLGDGTRHRVGLDNRFGLGLRLGPSRLEFFAALERQQSLVRSREDAFLAPMAVDELAQ